MLFRLLVNQFIRRTAEQQIYQQVSKMRGERSNQPVAQRQDAATGPPDEPVDLVFLFALSVESGGLVDLLQSAVRTQCASFSEHAGRLDDRRVVVAESGVGCQLAGQATEDLIQLYRPKWVVSAGFAGALNQDMRRGHILMADHLVDTQGNQLDVGLRMEPQAARATKGLHVGRLLTVDRLIRTGQEKRELGQTYQALACDMETMGVAEVCRRRAVRLLAVRVISDTVEDHLPPEIEKLMGQTSAAGKLGAAAGAFFQRPSVVKDMWKLKEDALRASDRLAKFLLSILPQLEN